MTDSSITALLPPGYPHRTLKECHDLMTGPGMPWELIEVEIEGRGPVKAFKTLWPSLKVLWLASVQAFPQREYIVYENERYTYADIHQKILSTANMLYHEYGCRKGDRIAIAARNMPEWITVHWAIHLIGGIQVSVNAWLNLKAFTHCITTSDARVVICDIERAKLMQPKLDEVKAAGALDVLVLRTGGKTIPHSMKDFNEAVKKYETNQVMPQVDIQPDDLATIFFTSGTTGLPKGVLGTQRQYLTNVLSTQVAPVRAMLRRGETIPAPDPTAPQKVTLLSVPLFHATGNHGALATATAMGGRIVMMYKWNTETAAKLIVDEGISSAGGLPFMAMELLEAVLLSKKGLKNPLESMSYGGGPSSDQMAKRIKNKMPDVLPVQGYGMTEVSCLATSVAGEDYLLRPKSTGLPSFICKVKIVDLDTGKDLPPNTPGEVLMGGINLTNCYWKNEKATKEAYLSDGWFRSGDIGYLDEDGFLYISDRAKDIIIRGGENISSVSVENELLTDDRLLDVAVVPVKDHRYGELVAAVVVTKPSFHGKVTEEQMVDLVKARMPKHCVPVIVDVRKETLPRNGVGKTDKNIIKSEVGKMWESRKSKL